MHRVNILHTLEFTILLDYFCAKITSCSGHRLSSSNGGSCAAKEECEFTYLTEIGNYKARGF